ncbi:hypothetical protein K435DRAFT_236812 [Dendrothele bispora CBS 962.96]|uniref:Uncharacterized protein n=1 Tax=Dendrothele bispora (strain CBS 962.96) TaxID=1314807 RepID=A0A4S8LPX6_DENBC|nr:hypothetical protein K435DRAFT_236812 [Dendrothele bispora CBS 962.96]
MIIKREDYSSSSMAATSAAALKAEEALAEASQNPSEHDAPPSYDDIDYNSVPNSNTSPSTASRPSSSDFQFVRPQPRAHHQQQSPPSSSQPTLRPPILDSHSAPVSTTLRHSSYDLSPHSPHFPPSLPSSSTLTLAVPSQTGSPHAPPSLPSSSTLTLVAPTHASHSPSLPSSSTQTLVSPTHIRHASHSPRSNSFPSDPGDDKPPPTHPSISGRRHSSTGTPHVAPVFVPKKRGFFNGGKEKVAKEAREWVIAHINDLVRQTHNYDLDACNSILGACTEACTLTSKLFLSDILREPIIDGHTPFYWSIIHRPAKSHLVPDLLVALLTFGSPLSNETRADIRHACLMVNDQKLFQHLRCSRKYMPERKPEMIVNGKHPFDEIRVQEYPGTEAVFTVDFEMPMFVKRMHLEQEVSLEFIAHRRAFHLHFKPSSSSKSSTPSWELTLTLSEFSSPTFVDSQFSILAPSPPSPPSAPKLPPRPTAPAGSIRPYTDKLGNNSKMNKHPKPSPSMPNLLSTTTNTNSRGNSPSPLGSPRGSPRLGGTPNHFANGTSSPKPAEPLTVRVKSYSMIAPGKKGITVSLEDCEIGTAIRMQ